MGDYRMIREIGLVSCVKSKRDEPAKPKGLYTSSYFEKMRERDLLRDGRAFVIHAGKDYYEELLPLLEDAGVNVQIPTDGLRFGETQSWYKNRL